MRKKIIIFTGIVTVAILLCTNFHQTGSNSLFGLTLSNIQKAYADSECTLYDDYECESSTSCYNNMSTAYCSTHNTIGCCSKNGDITGNAKT